MSSPTDTQLKQALAKTEACENHFKIKQAAVVENVRLKSELTAKERELTTINAERAETIILRREMIKAQSNLTTLQKVARDLAEALSASHSHLLQCDHMTPYTHHIADKALTAYNSLPKEVKGQ